MASISRNQENLQSNQQYSFNKSEYIKIIQNIMETEK